MRRQTSSVATDPSSSASNNLLSLSYQSKLVRAVFSQKWKKVTQMLKTKTCIEQVLKSNNFKGITTLSIVVSYNPPVDIVQTLLAIAPSHSLMVDSYGMLPLNIACMNGASSAIIKLILDHDDGASAQAIDIFQRTPLHYAVQYVVEPESLGGGGSSGGGSSSKKKGSRNPSSHCSQMSMSESRFQDQILVIQALVQAEPELALCADKENRTPIDILQDCKATHKEGSKWERADIICDMLRQISTRVYREKKIVSEMQGYKRTNIFGAPNMTMSATSSSYSSNLSGNHSATSNFSNMEVDCTSFNQMDVSLGEVASKEQVETDKRRHVRLKMMKSRKWKEEPSDMDLT